MLAKRITVTKIKKMAPAGIALSCHLERMLLHRPVLRITHVIPSTLYGWMDHTPHSMGGLKISPWQDLSGENHMITIIVSNGLALL